MGVLYCQFSELQWHFYFCLKSSTGSRFPTVSTGGNAPFLYGTVGNILIRRKISATLTLAGNTVFALLRDINTTRGILINIYPAKIVYVTKNIHATWNACVICISPTPKYVLPRLTLSRFCSGKVPPMQKCVKSFCILDSDHSPAIHPLFPVLCSKTSDQSPYIL